MRSFSIRIVTLGLALLCGACTTSRTGSWEGELVAGTGYDTQQRVQHRVVKLRLDAGQGVPKSMRETTEPVLLADRRRRAIGPSNLPRLGRARVKGTLAITNVRTPDGRGWLCGPPPRGLLDSVRTCRVLEARSVQLR